MGGGGFATGNMNTENRLGVMTGEGRWWEAFGTGGFEGEPSLMEGGSRSATHAQGKLVGEGKLTGRAGDQPNAYSTEEHDRFEPSCQGRQAHHGRR